MSAIKDFFIRHATWATISAVVLILGVGVVVIEQPSLWWVGLVVFGVAALALFIVANARIVLKILLSVGVLLGASFLAASLGIYATSFPVVGILWALFHIAAYLGLLAVSFLIHSGVGRWLVLTAATILQFIVTSAILVANVPASWALLIGAMAGVVTFMLIYLFNPRTVVSKHMPPSSFSEDFFKAIVRGADKLGYEARLLSSRGNLGSAVLLFKEKAFILYPAALEQSFGIRGKRSKHLSYNYKGINPWLLKILHTYAAWGGKKADRGVVIVDTKRRNGGTGKMIGVSSPDTNKRMLVGIAPGSAKALHRVSYGEETIRAAERLIEGSIKPLSPKQKAAVGKIGYAPEQLADFIEDEEKLEPSENVQETKEENSEQ